MGTFLQEFREATDTPLSNRWTYSCLCLETLLQVGDKLEIEAATDRAGSTNAPCEPLFLSVRQEKEVAACLQLVVSFGLLPNLLPNIGVPIQKRSKWWDILGQPQPISDEQVQICKGTIGRLISELFCRSTRG